MISLNRKSVCSIEKETKGKKTHSEIFTVNKTYSGNNGHWRPCLLRTIRNKTAGTKRFPSFVDPNQRKINKSSTDVTLAYMKRNVAFCFMRGYFYVQKEQQSNVFELDYSSFFPVFPPQHHTKASFLPTKIYTGQKKVKGTHKLHISSWQMEYWRWKSLLTNSALCLLLQIKWQYKQ